MSEFSRMTINQPSAAQEYHKYDREHVLAERTDDKYVRVYFTRGPIVSMDVKWSALVKGWI